MVERLSKSSVVEGCRHQVGESLGNYRLESVLHLDGLTEVYRAVDVRDDGVCLVKCFGGALTEYDVEVAERIMEHESSLLHHPELSVNREVVAAFAPLESFVASECKEGRALAEVLRNEGPFSESYCLTVVRNVVAALKPFEEAGVGHGSLTLNGVHVCSDGRILLESRGFPGLTGCFASPESICGQIDVRSDFFSIGAMMYMLLTGHEPFGNAGRVEPLWERRPELSSDMVLLVHRLLNEDREARPMDVAEMTSWLSEVDTSSHLTMDELKEMTSGGGRRIKSGKIVKRMKGVSDDVKRRRFQAGGSWIMKVSYVMLFVLAFGVGYGLALSREDDNCLQRRLAFLSPLMKVPEKKGEVDVKESLKTEVATDIERWTAVADEPDVPVAEDEPDVPVAETEATVLLGGKGDAVDSEGAEERRGEASGRTDGTVGDAVEEDDEEEGFVADDKKKEDEKTGGPALDEAKEKAADLKKEEEEAKKLQISEETRQRQKQLEAALKRRNVREIKALLDAGAKLDWVSEDGTSLLQQACARGHWDAVEYMLRQGADVNWRPRVAGEKFKMPLQIAIGSGRKTHDAVLMLLKHKADPEILYSAGLFFANNENETGTVTQGGVAGIVGMCQSGYLRDNPPLQQEVFNTWFDANKDDMTNEIKAQVLANAIEQKMAKGVLKTMIQRIKTMKDPAYGRVLLAAMKHKNRIELLGRLKDMGINVNTVCKIEKDGVTLNETPLYYAVKNKCDEEVIRWLLANGANVKWASDDGKTVMDLDMSPNTKLMLLEAKQGKKVTQEWNGDLYTTGETTIRTNMPWDADLNAVTVKGKDSDWVTASSAKDQKLVETDVDFFWKYDKESKRLMLELRNGCEATLMNGNLTPFQQVQVDYIAKQTFTDKPLEYTKDENSPLRRGNVVLFRTSKGNFGKFRVIRYEDEVIDKKKRRNVALRIHWFVYHLEEQEVRESHSKRTIW